MTDANLKKLAKKKLEDILKLLDIEAKIKVNIDKADDDKEIPEDQESEFARRPRKYVSMVLDGEDLGVLIGYHGKNLSSIQYLLGTLIAREVDDDEFSYRVLLDINGYKEERSDRLKEITDRKLEELRESGESEIDLPPMKPDERRVIHMYVKELEGVKTESIGEGRDRRIKLMLDI